ncbi:MAG: helix-turn-helix transcriptional regulator [Sulfurimonas sp.]|uniref:helix-turn-helix domain-containing protein n=1 Tax=Sulfurimonas sp. TaxID=2022749 RepID=UPI0026141AED|nr:helix-turn-helix transcriptional regulator [Sulfurimonas sp.]MDD5400135.1 helix-turn-helix transcriptional regulator [Sulfurimonas sp.]
MQINNNPVKNICSTMNLTQIELSKLMGVSEGTVNRWSSKPNEIPLQTIYFMNLIIEHSFLLNKLEKYFLFTSLIKELIND